MVCTSTSAISAVSYSTDTIATTGHICYPDYGSDYDSFVVKKNSNLPYLHSYEGLDSQVVPSIMNIDIADVQIEYETVKDIKVNPDERDDKGNYQVTKRVIKKPVKVIVVFKNGNTQHALCHKDDKFDLEIGISICIMKELLHRLNVVNPTKAYNDLIKTGVKVYNEKQKFIQELQKQEEAKKIKEASKQRRRQRKAAKKKEREIEIFAEAIRRSRISEDTNK